MYPGSIIPRQSTRSKPARANLCAAPQTPNPSTLSNLRPNLYPLYRPAPALDTGRAAWRGHKLPVTDSPLRPPDPCRLRLSAGEADPGPGSSRPYGVPSATQVDVT
jgi:hypothetical protein